MLKRTHAAIALLLLISNPTPGADTEFALLETERIGDLRLGMSESALKDKIPCRLQRGPEELWGADEAWHQDWVYKACGITLGMSSDKKGGRKSIASISVSAPSELSTRRGIRIGSPEQEVRKAYRRDWNQEDSQANGGFVAGSVFGGLIFQFKGGQVSSIFLGAASE